MKIQQRFAPYIYGMIQAAITTAVATGIATLQWSDSGMALLQRWLTAWALSWLTMLPVVVLIAPVIQKIVVSMVTPERELES